MPASNHAHLALVSHRPLRSDPGAKSLRSLTRVRVFPATHMTIATKTADRRTVKINEAAELARVSRRTIYNRMASGKVEYVRTAGGPVRILVDSLWRRHRRRKK